MIKVEYQGGQSRYGRHPVVYMRAVVDEIELYAEMPTDDDDMAIYDSLKADIIAQAQAHDIDVGRLEFWRDTTLYNANQLAKTLGISREAVRRRLERGTLRGDCFLADGQPLFTEETLQRLRGGTHG
ncbi:hypothetical protein [Paenibacillus ginsengihumi]|uniref:hypothetical protein n=1 Tax=Paenibacillus ginsengihumi TaxID=431596 RepID=UPI00035DA60B|nr:hypothetical protein [Paenibacillus ginsengihumi]